MASYRSTLERFGAIEISNNGYIDSRDTKVKNVQYPTENGDATNKEYVDRFTHVGDIKMSVHNTDFYGWLKCDGRSVSRTTYADLFAIIGTSFGSSSGTTFNLPDCRGRVLGTLGQGAGLTNRTLGQNAGEETHTMTTAEMPAHTHTGTTVSNGSHNHTGTIDSSGTHAHTITDPGHTHSWNYGIEGDDSGNGGSYGEFTAIPGTVTSSIASATTGITVNSAGEHTHTMSISTNGAHTHTFTSDSTGGGNAFNVMQPTLFIANVFIYSGNEN
jgi:microcystin-dependent protein